MRNESLARRRRCPRRPSGSPIPGQARKRAARRLVLGAPLRSLGLCIGIAAAPAAFGADGVGGQTGGESGTSAPKSSAVEPIRLVASIPPLGALAQMVGGEFVDVRVLLPPGASPHGYEPGPDAVRALARAEGHIVIGRLLDPWMETLARGSNPKARIERLGYDLPGPEPPADPHDEEGDPHVWMDPVKAGVMAERIGSVLASLRPQWADSLRSRAATAKARLDSLDRFAGERLAPVRDVPFVAFHGGLNHLVARYGLRQVGVLEPFPGREPSPRWLKEIVSEIKRSGARAILAEPQFSSRLSEVVGRETGVPVVEIDLIGGADGPEAYEALLRAVVDRLAGALSERAVE